jgi:hypothetical protein
LSKVKLGANTMRDTKDIYQDIPDDSALWVSLHRDATCLEKRAFTATHRETIRRHYLDMGRRVSEDEAHAMAHEVWWDVRILGVDPTIGLHVSPAPCEATAIASPLPTASRPVKSARRPPDVTRKNVGKTDRVIRGSLGVFLIVGAVRNGGMGGLIGAVLLATAYLGFCPAYRAFDFSTHKDHGTAKDETPATN